MYCKDCKYREAKKVYFTHKPPPYLCTNEHIMESTMYGSDEYEGNDRLIYSYDEGGYFEVEDFFGCVHFEQRVIQKGG